MAVAEADLEAWLLASLPELPPEPEVLPEMPHWPREADQWVEPPSCECGRECFPGVPAGDAAGEPKVVSLTRSPQLLADRFAVEWAAVQRHTARMWRAAATMHAATGAASAEFVGDDLALLTNTHPRSGAFLLTTAVSVCQVPELVALLEAGELGDRHVLALLDEATRWTDSAEQQRRVLELTVQRCRGRVEAGQGWPTPAQLRERVRTAAVLLDLTAAEKRKESVSRRRGVSVYPTGAGGAGLSIEGPQVQVAQMMDAIRARAEALGTLPGDTRTLDQRLFDAAHDLLSVDADGGPSRVPALGLDGQPVTIDVGGVEISLLMPFSVAAGADLELATLPGLGPVLPSTARELLAQAHSVERVAVDARTGQVLAVDDPVPGPARLRRRPTPPRPVPDATPAAPAPTATDAFTTDPADAVPLAEVQSDDVVPADVVPADVVPADVVPAEVQKVLDGLVSARVVRRDLSSEGYRVGRRLRRYVERRDRTCTFPGCTVPGRRCDIDHREPWPHGPTDDKNCHCLCRRHHRGKQCYFTVELDGDGSTIWTTPDGRRYRRPPPTF